jgi:hypothetical protein
VEGLPFEVMLCSGKYHDIDPFKLMHLDLSEAIFMEIVLIQIMKRKKNLENGLSES